MEKDPAKLVDMPCSVRGFATRTVEPDGDYYTIVLNARLTHEMHQRSYKHEEQHIESGDFDAGGSVDEIEARAHGR